MIATELLNVDNCTLLEHTEQELELAVHNVQRLLPRLVCLLT